MMLSIMRPPEAGSLQQRDDVIDHLVVVDELGVVVLADAPADPAELQADDAAEHLVGERIVGDRDDAAEQRRREGLQEFGLERRRQRLGSAA